MIDKAMKVCCVALAVLAPCASAQSDAEALLGLDAVEEGDARENCIYARDVKRFEILSDRMILVYGKFDRFWLNRLAQRCPGLRKNMIVTLNRHGSQMCQTDRFAARAGAGPNDGPLRQCQLGTFEEIVVEQIPTLRQAARKS